MNNFNHKGNGQGNLFSKMSHRLSTNGSSIVTRRASRSLTKRGLQIQVHQHFGYKLHLVWRGTRNGVSSELYGEDLPAPKYEDVDKFCTELKNGALEGLCDCVSEGVAEFLEEKAKLCFMTPPLQPETEKSIPRS